MKTANSNQGDKSFRQTRARARATARARVMTFSEYQQRRESLEQAKLRSGFKPSHTPNGPIVWDTAEYIAAAASTGTAKEIVSAQVAQWRNALATPEAIARARVSADTRLERAKRRKAARLARYVRGGKAPSEPIDGALNRFGFRMPFIRSADERARYAGFWFKLDALKLDGAAQRATRSVRAGKVSETSRDEAKGAARASLLQAAANLAPIHLSAAIDRVCRSADCLGDANASARASLRGDALGGMKARNSDVTGRAAANDDGNGGLVWSITRGEWIKVKRADGATAIDLAGRMVCDERGTMSDDQAAHSWARDAVRLVGWLVRLRLARMAGERGQAVAPCVRSRIRAAASKIARVLRSMARGASLELACVAVGFSDASDCRAWRKAVSALTEGKGLADAMRDFRASLSA